MEILRTIITNEKELEPHLIKIVKSHEIPNVFDKSYLSHLGFSDSDCVLYFRLFVNLGLVSLDGKPTPYYKKFVKSVAKSRELMAEVLYHSYAELFEYIPNVDRLPPKIALATVRSMVGEMMSETYLKKAIRTFFSLVKYADRTTLTELKKINKYEKIAFERRPETEHEAFLLELLHGQKNHAYRKSLPTLSGTRFAEIKELVCSIDSTRSGGLII